MDYGLRVQCKNSDLSNRLLKANDMLSHSAVGSSQSSLNADEVSCRTRAERCPSSESHTEDTPLCSVKSLVPPLST